MKFRETTVSEKLTIRELANEELKKAFPIVKQLRPNLDYAEYVRLVGIMKEDGYQIICLLEDGEIVAYAGIAQRTELYYGSHIWVYDLVTDENKRSKGYGKILLLHIEQCAKDSALHCVALASGLLKVDAHRFYEDTMGYDKICYGFCKII